MNITVFQGIGAISTSWEDENNEKKLLNGIDFWLMSSNVGTVRFDLAECIATIFALRFAGGRVRTGSLIIDSTRPIGPCVSGVSGPVSKKSIRCKNDRSVLCCLGARVSELALIIDCAAAGVARQISSYANCHNSEIN